MEIVDKQFATVSIQNGVDGCERIQKTHIRVQSVCNLENANI